VCCVFPEQTRVFGLLRRRRQWYLIQISLCSPTGPISIGTSTYLQTATNGIATFVTPIATIAAPTLSSYTSTLFDFTQSQSVELMPLSGSNPIVGTWQLTGLTAINNIPDYNGVPQATALTESGTSARLASLAGTIPAGWVRVKFSYLPGSEFEAKHFNFRFMSSPVSHIVYLPSLRALQYPGCDTGGSVYTPNKSGYFNGFKFTPRSNRWIDVEYETNVASAQVEATYLCQIGNSGVSDFARTGVVITIAGLTVQQDRVVYVTPVRGSTDLALAQGLDSARPVLSPDIWFGHPALVEGYGNSCALSSAIPSCTLASAGGVFWVREHSPTSTARQIFSLNGASSKLSANVDPSGVWSITRTNDAGVTVTTLTTHSIAPVPVRVDLVQDASSVSLYIDGTLASGGTVSTPTAATYTSRTLFGGDSRSVCANWDDTLGVALTAAQVAVKSNESRAMAHLPAQWPLTLIAGQSNAVSIKGTSFRLVGNGVFARPGYAFYEGDNGYATAFGWDADPVTGQSGMGVRLGWQREAQIDNAPSVVVNCAHGGAAITSWDPGGADYVYTQSAIAAAIASFGTSLYAWTDLVWIQGEYESNDPATVPGYHTGKLTALIAWYRGLLGNVTVTIHRINEWLGASTTTPTATYVSAGIVRADQDLVAATVPNVFISRLDGGDRTGWQVHYSPAQCVEIGSNCHRVSRHQSARLAIVEPDLPQRGTWSTGGYWDTEHGVALSGTTITSITSREGSTVLTAYGSPQLGTDIVGGRRVAKCANGKYFQSKDAVHWAPFGGASPSPFILGISWWTGPIESDGGVLFLGNNDVSNSRSIEMSLSAGSATTIRYGQGGTVQTTLQGALAIAANTNQIVVYAADGVACYRINASGIFKITEAATAYAGVNCLNFNARWADGTYATSDNALRKLCVKTPATSDVLGEAVDLYTALSALY